MGRLATRSQATAEQQILAELANLARSWGDTRPEGVCDILLERLVFTKPALCSDLTSCAQHKGLFT